MKKLFCLFYSVVIILSCFSGCKKNDDGKVTDIIQEATIVSINGTQVDTVEASMGAFEGKQGDFIEFRFSELQTFNTIFIIEKTTSIRQFNVYAEVEGKYKLVYTGKNVFSENIEIDPVTTSSFKFEVVNTEIGNDNFIIQGISAYNITEGN